MLIYGVTFLVYLPLVAGVAIRQAKYFTTSHKFNRNDGDKYPKASLIRPGTYLIVNIDSPQ